MAKVRLNKYIASAGICSRRKADEMIEQGLVNVNGKRVSELGYLVSEKDKVFIEGKLIHPLKHEYYRFYKPAGYITTADDEKGRKTIYDILPKELHHLKPVGRLDKDSKGLILFTNDGVFSRKIIGEESECEKEYYVKLEGNISDGALKKLEFGISLDGKKLKPAIVKRVSKNSFNIILKEGRNRQIRRMCEKVGFEVILLKRLRISNIYLNDSSSFKIYVILQT